MRDFHHADKVKKTTLPAQFNLNNYFESLLSNARQPPPKPFAQFKRLSLSERKGAGGAYSSRFLWVLLFLFWGQLAVAEDTVTGRAHSLPCAVCFTWRSSSFNFSVFDLAVKLTFFWAAELTSQSESSRNWSMSFPKISSYTQSVLRCMKWFLTPFNVRI